MTKFAFIAMLALAISGCSGRGSGDALYRSVDGGTILLSNGKKYYLGPAETPPVQNFLEKYGTDIKYTDKCILIGNIAFLKPGNQSGICDGILIQTKRYQSGGSSQIYDSICGSFHDGRCHTMPNDPAPMIVSYERDNEGIVSTIYLAGFAQRDGTNTLRRESGYPF